MNVTYNIFSNINGSGIGLMETFRLSISSIYKSCIVKFHKLVTNWFFIFKKWINTWKQFTECFTGNSPKKLILFSPFALNSICKRDTASESLQQPFKNWCFCIIKLKANFVSIIRSIFGFIFVNAQAAFGINESSKIGIIYLFNFIHSIKNVVLHAVKSIKVTEMDNPTEITGSDVDVVTRTLLNNDAYTIMDNIEGEDKYGTAPVRDAYFALSSTQITGNLNNIKGFLQKNQYPAPMNALRSEWGAIGSLRFLVSSIGSLTEHSSNLDQTVYNNICVGMEAYACIEQDGYSASFIYRPPIYDGPLALNISVGYKFAEVPRITNDLWVINLRSTLA